MTIEELKRIRNGLEDNDLINMIDAEIARQSDIARAEFNHKNGDYWIWEEPDEANHIESMADHSLVMIKAHVLRKMYNTMKKTKGA